MSKDNVFTYEPKMKANWELIAEIMCCDCQEIVYKDKQITDLEAKLALYDEVIKEREDDIETLHLIRENLEQQLAEKDKEILDVKNWWSYQYNGEIERHNQDKISFCIEQLEKVKEYCRQEAYHDSYGDYMIVYERRYYEDDEEKTPNDDLMGFLDNQIKQLKEMK